MCVSLLSCRCEKTLTPAGSGKAGFIWLTDYCLLSRKPRSELKAGPGSRNKSNTVEEGCSLPCFPGSCPATFFTLLRSTCLGRVPPTLMTNKMLPHTYQHTNGMEAISLLRSLLPRFLSNHLKLPMTPQWITVKLLHLNIC